MTKAKVWIGDDAWWPVPYYGRKPNSYDDETEVPVEVLEEFDKATAAFSAACNKLNSFRKTKR